MITWAELAANFCQTSFLEPPAFCGSHLLPLRCRPQPSEGSTHHRHLRLHCGCLSAWHSARTPAMPRLFSPRSRCVRLDLSRSRLAMYWQPWLVRLQHHSLQGGRRRVRPCWAAPRHGVLNPGPQRKDAIPSTSGGTLRAKGTRGWEMGRSSPASRLGRGGSLRGLLGNGGAGAGSGLLPHRRSPAHGPPHHGSMSCLLKGPTLARQVSLILSKNLPFQ